MTSGAGDAASPKTDRFKIGRAGSHTTTSSPAIEVRCPPPSLAAFQNGAALAVWHAVVKTIHISSMQRSFGICPFRFESL